MNFSGGIANPMVTEEIIADYVRESCPFQQLST